MKKLFQIQAPHFCAGGEINSNEIVVSAAPIIKYMIGWSKVKVDAYCETNKWKFLVEPFDKN